MTRTPPNNMQPRIIVAWVTGVVSRVNEYKFQLLNRSHMLSNRIHRLVLVLNIFLTFSLVLLIGMIALKMENAQFNRPIITVVTAAVTAIVTNVCLSIAKRAIRSS